MSKYINLDRVKEVFDYAENEFCECDYAVKNIREAVENLPAADVMPVRPIIDRMNKERKRAKGNWHTDPYWLGWVDAMQRAQRIVDGTIDNEPVYAPSTGEKKEDNQG